MQGSQGKQIGLLAVCLLFLVAIVVPATAQKKGTEQDVIAKVNDAVISKQSLDQEMAVILQQLSQMGRPAPDASQMEGLRTTVLEGLIDGELLYQESAKAGVVVDDAAINDKLINLKRQFPTEDEFKKALNAMNTTEPELKAQLHKSMTIKQLIEQKVESKIVINDQETKEFYDANLDKFKQPEQVRASHILIAVKPDADDAAKEAARKKIASIQQQIKDGKDFGELAKTNSEGPSSVKGGDLGYFGRGQMVKPFEDAAFAMKPGEVSGVVETQFGLHLIKVVDKKTGSVAGYDEVKDRIAEFLKKQRMDEEMTAYVQDLRSKAVISRLTPEDK